MAMEFRMPDLGENIQSADVGQVLVAVGDVLKPEQVILELETDKAVFELPCPQAGKVSKIHVKKGDKVSVGDVILTLEGAPATKEEAPASPAPKQETAKVESVKQPAKAASEEKKSPPSQADVAPPSRPAETTMGGPAKNEAPLDTVKTKAPAGEDGVPAPAGPATRRLARELGVELHNVAGSGPGGRITTEDVQSYVKQSLKGGGTSRGSSKMAIPPLPDFKEFGPTERRPMNKIAKTSAANLSLAWHVAPHVTQHDLADITELEAGRKRFVDANPKAPKITMTVLALKAAVAALKAFPQFNASLDAATDEIVFKQYYHLGIAVDTENGLIVPVIRDVDKKSILQLASEVSELAEKARSRKIGISDLKGGSFTISNLGGIGGTAFTPIVNYPEVAILGLSKSRWQQTMHNNEPALRLLLPLSVSYDHRVVNGADGARFTAKLAQLLSDPFQLLSEC